MPGPAAKLIFIRGDAISPVYLDSSSGPLLPARLHLLNKLSLEGVLRMSSEEGPALTGLKTDGDGAQAIAQRVPRSEHRAVSRSNDLPLAPTSHSEAAHLLRESVILRCVRALSVLFSSTHPYIHWPTIMPRKSLFRNS